MLAHGVDQARNQQIAGGLRTREETVHEIAGALLIPFQAGPTLRVQERPFGFAPLEETFFEEAVERGHHGGVCKWSHKLVRDVADVAFAARPENVHDLDLEGAEVVFGEAEQTKILAVLEVVEFEVGYELDARDDFLG